MARGHKQIIYREYLDFSGGFNDTTAEDLLKDTELVLCDNMVISEGGALNVRNGTSIVNGDSANNAHYTKLFEYIVKSQSILVEVLDKKLYIKHGDNVAQLLDVELATDKPNFLQQQNVLYILDGDEIYEFGQKDYFSNVGTLDIKQGDVVQCTDGTADEYVGRFYQALADIAGVDLSTENYGDTAKWADVTYLEGAISNVLRPLKKYDMAQPEITQFYFFGTTVYDGIISISLNGNVYPYEVGKDATAENTAALMLSAASAECKAAYDITVSGNTVNFTAKEKALHTDGYVVSNTTGITMVAVTKQQGASDNNVMDEVKKCTLFGMHSKSARYVATGNPDKPYSVYLSEPYQLNYFKSTNVLTPVSGEGDPTCILNLLDSVLIGYQTSWYEYSGIDPATDGTWKRLAIPFGCIAGESVQMIDLYNFMYLGHNGLNIVNSNILSQYGSVIQNSSGVRNISHGKVDNTLASITNYKRCTSVYHNDIYYLAFNDGTDDSEYNNSVLLYDTQNKAFTLFKDLTVHDFQYTLDGKLVFGSKNYVLMYDDTRYTDVDVETGADKKIEFTVKTGSLNIANLGSDVFLDKLFLKFKQNIADTNQHIYAVYSVDDAEYKEPLLSNINSFIWGESNWGEQWGKRNVTLQSLFMRKKGTYLRLEITNKYTTALDSKIVLYGFSVGYKPFIQHQHISNNKFF